MIAGRAAVAIARHLHRLLVRCAPARVRRTYGAEMTRTFDDALADAATTGILAIVAVTWRELVDVLRAHRSIRSAASMSARERRPRRLVAVGAWLQTWRSLRRRPAYFLTTTTTLAVSIGVLTVVLALVDNALIKPLPYPSPEALVTVYEASPAARDRTSLIAPARLNDWQARTRAFSAISASYSENVTDTSGVEPERLDARRVLPEFFDVYAVVPIVGRTFRDEEERYGGPGAVVISERLWARRYERSAAVLDRALTIGGRSHAIVGVMPAAFSAAATDVWLPAQISPFLLNLRDARFVAGIGRLRPGISLADGDAELRAIQTDLGRDHPATDAGWSVQVKSLSEARIGDARRGLVILAAAVTTLWVIALANVVALMLLHIKGRGHELALRTALGASRRQAIAVLVRESVVVCAVGSVAGLVLAAWLIRVLPALRPDVPRIAELQLDVRSAMIAGALTAASLVVSALASWFGPPRRAPGAATGRTVAGGAHGPQRALVVVQVALSVMLLATCHLLIRSYVSMRSAPLGFEPADVVAFHVGARWDEDRDAIGVFQERLLSKLSELPHVTAAGLTNFLPATGGTLRYRVRVDGVNGPNDDGTLTVGGRMMAGAYLTAIRARVVDGAPCEPPAPGQAPRRDVVVNRVLADQANGAAIIGRRLWVAQGAEPYRITGIVDPIAEDGLAESPPAYIYTCDPRGAWPDPEYVVRTTHPTAFLTDLRRVVRELDPARAIFSVRDLSTVLDTALDRPRFEARATTMFAIAALALAATGLYSLFALLVAENRRATAIRMALGASGAQVIRHLVANAALLCSAGVAIGVALTAGVDRWLRSAVAGARSADAAAIATAAAVLMVAAICAVASPVRRALRTPAVDALRVD